MGALVRALLCYLILTQCEELDLGGKRGQCNPMLYTVLLSRSSLSKKEQFFLKQEVLLIVFFRFLY